MPSELEALMVWRRFVQGILAVVFIPCAVMTQVTVQVIIKNPTPSQLSIWQSDPSVVTVVITNAGQSSYPDVRASYVVKDANTTATVARSLDNSPSTPRFSIGPFQTLTKNGHDIVIPNAVDVDPAWQNKLITSGGLPEGQYEYCLTLIDKSGSAISGSGQVCRQFTVIQPDPPTLVTPNKGDTLSSLALPMFQWTPVMIVSGGPAQYRIKIAPIFGTQSPATAMSVNASLFDRTVPSTTYLYLPSDPAWSSISNANGFAWQVQSLDQSNKSVGKNDGKSEVWSVYPPSAKSSNPADSTSGKSSNQTTAGNCNDPCTTSAPGDQTASSKSFSVGDTISVGLFRMGLTKLTGSVGTALSGEGTIPVPYLRAPIKVQFSSIQVNASGQMIKGDVTGKQDLSSPLNDAIANDMNALKLKNSDIDNVMKLTQQESKLVSAFVMSTPVGLPIGLDNVTDGFPMTIGIVGMDFTPTQATLKAVAQYPFPDLGPTVGLGVGAANICFQPGGISTKQGMLYLVEDLGIDQPNSFGFLFKAPAGNDSGTYMMWDCKGFKELRLRADVLFPRDWLIPQPDNGMKVAAAIRTTIRKSGDWIASVNMDTCVIAGSSGMKLFVKEMAYDHSDVVNPQGIVFPSNYPKGTPGPDWHGFFIKSAVVVLPEQLKTFKGSPPQIVASNIIIDGAGFTGMFAMTNVLQYPEGDFGDWGASIDSIGVNFVCSSLTEGRMVGRFQIPISDSPLDYHALFSNPPNAKMKFSFTITPRGTISAPLWAATLNLDNTSRIELVDSAGSFVASAVFNGDLTINGKVGDLPAIDFKGIKFQNVMLSSKSPYFSSGTWSFASPQHGVAGFPVSLKDIKFVSGARKSGIGFGLQFTIDADIAEVISGSTTLSVWAVMGTSPGQAQMFKFDGVDLDAITVKADLGAVTINGSILLYHDDPTFGNGFRGELDANFLAMLQIKAVAQFGSVSGYRYWYVDASALFPPGIPVFSGVGFYGFGGGAWYHMNMKPVPAIADNPSIKNTPGATKSGFTFTPDQSVDLGLQAGVTLGTHPSPNAFAADITLMAQFQNGGIGSIGLAGKGYIISSGIAQREQASIRADVSIYYDFVNSVFEGNFHVWSQGSLAAVAKIDASVNMHYDPKNWHLLIGTPAQELSVTLVSFVTVQAYIMAGTDIPAPDPNNFPHKADVERSIGQPIPATHVPIPEKTEGFATGASLSAQFDLTYLIFRAHMAFGFGFDVAVVHMTNVVCSNMGNQQPGINGWFGYGDLYAYVDFSISIHVDVWFTEGDFTILDMGAGALCQFTIPNPTWVRGMVGGHFSILDGLVEGNCSFMFELGQQCLQSSDAITVDLINEIQPANATTKYDVYGRPTVSLHFPVNIPFDLQYQEGGHNKTSTFRVVVDSYGITSPAGVQCHWDSPDGYILFLLHDQHFPEKQSLTMSIALHAEQQVNGVWQMAHRHKDNSEIRDSRTISFSTGPMPDHIVDQIVEYTIPHSRQRYFLKGEEPIGRISAFEEIGNFFEPGAAITKTSYVAKFIPIPSGTTLETPVTLDGSRKSITFPLPALANGQEYALQIVRRWMQTVSFLPNLGSLTGSQSGSGSISNKGILNAKASMASPAVHTKDVIINARPQHAPPPGSETAPNEHLLYLLYFKTSNYSTLTDKVNAMKFLRTDYSKYWGTHEAITPVYQSDEGFDGYDVNGYTRHGSMGDTPADPLVRVDAQAPSENWYNSAVRKGLYQHIIEFQIRGLWHFDPSLQDNAFALFTIGTPGPFVNFLTPADALISLPVPPTPPSRFSVLSGASLGLNKSVAREFKFRYLHPELIPTDYINLRFAAARVLWEYANGGNEDDGSDLYGKGNWVSASQGWLQAACAGSLDDYAAKYPGIQSGSYAIAFVYGPKLSFDGKGPWIKKSFTYGKSGSMILNTVKSSYIKRP
jgi:hypothetical protein